jgi:hypothetical protein
VQGEIVAAKPIAEVLLVALEICCGKDLPRDVIDPPQSIQ